MYRLTELIINVLFWVTLFLLTLLAIKLAEIFGSNWFLILIPLFFGGLVYLFLYVEDYTHYILLAIDRFRYRKK
jgi:hypothetical protein